MSPTHDRTPVTPREPMIAVSSMLDTLALVLAGAVSRYRWGLPPQGAINAALREHSVAPVTELACRVTWYAMLEVVEAQVGEVSITRTDSQALTALVEQLDDAKLTLPGDPRHRRLRFQIAD